jgi:hypothetical protein
MSNNVDTTVAGSNPALSATFSPEFPQEPPEFTEASFPTPLPLFPPVQITSRSDFSRFPLPITIPRIPRVRNLLPPREYCESSSSTPTGGLAPVTRCF